MDKDNKNNIRGELEGLKRVITLKKRETSLIGQYLGLDQDTPLPNPLYIIREDEGPRDEGLRFILKQSEFHHEENLKPFLMSKDRLENYQGHEDYHLLQLFSRYVFDRTPTLSRNKNTQLSTIDIPKVLCDYAVKELITTGRFFLEKDGAGLIPLKFYQKNFLQFEIFVNDEFDYWSLKINYYDGKSPIDPSRISFFLSAGLVIVDQTIFRIKTKGIDPLLIKLKLREKIVVPKDETDYLLELISAIGVEIPLNVPENFPLKRKLIQPQFEIHFKPNIGPSGVFILGLVYVNYDEDRVSLLSQEELRIKDGIFRQRDIDKETEFLKELYKIGLLNITHNDNITKISMGHEDFFKSLLSLQELGVVLKGEGNKKWVIPRINPTKIKSEEDWFEIKGSLEFEGEEFGLNTILRKRDEQGHFILSEDTRGILPEQWLKKHLTLHALGERKQDAIVLNKQQALLLDMLFEEQSIKRESNYKINNIKEGLQKLKKNVLENPPASFQAKLRDYQKNGLAWLKTLNALSLGGILADDMGLGKTVQVLAFLESKRLEKKSQGSKLKSLIIVPNSLLSNWAYEAQKFVPSLNCQIYHGGPKKRESLRREWDEFETVITTYGILRLDQEILGKRHFDAVILDEAQTIKNPEAKTSRAVSTLNSDFRLALTGTPVENHLGELYSLFKFLLPGLFGTKILSKDLLSRNDIFVNNILRGLSPLILRRLKKDVLTELPEKSESFIYLDLPKAQRAQYEAMKKKLQESLKAEWSEGGYGQHKMHILEGLLRLRQIATHPRLIDFHNKELESAKLDFLMFKLREIRENGHKILVFSQFTTLLKLISEKLEEVNVDYAYLDGQTRDRDAEIQKFKTNHDCGIFLLSIKAGGVGLNLTEASYVFIMDPWWNPSIEAQAIDRAHRMGQTQDVFSYKLIAKDTVEEKIVKLQESKKKQVDRLVISQSFNLSELTLDDFHFLFS